MASSKRPKGFWQDPENYFKRATELFEECKALGIKFNTTNLRKLKDGNVIIKYAEHHGGWMSICEKLGISTVLPDGYWDDDANFEAAVKAEYDAIVAEGGIFSTTSLRERPLGRKLIQAARKRGGLKIACLKYPFVINHGFRSTWTRELAEEKLHQFKQQLDKQGKILSIKNVQNIEGGYALVGATVARFGGWTNFLNECGYTSDGRSRGWWEDLNNLLSIGREISNDLGDRSWTWKEIEKIENGQMFLKACRQHHGGFHRVSDLLGRRISTVHYNKVGKKLWMNDIKQALVNLNLEIDETGGYDLHPQVLLGIVTQALGDDYHKNPKAKKVLEQIFDGIQAPGETGKNNAQKLHDWAKGKLDDLDFSEELEGFSEPKSVDDPDVTKTKVEQIKTTDTQTGSQDGTDNAGTSVDSLKPKRIDNQLKALDSLHFVGNDRENIATMKLYTSKALLDEAYKSVDSCNLVINKCKTYNAKRQWTSECLQELAELLIECRDMQLPSSYNFRKNGKLTQPRIMQKHVAVMAKQLREVLVMSDMGTGKTLAAQLAVLYNNCKRILVIPKNECANQWVDEFNNQWNNVHAEFITLDQMREEFITGGAIVNDHETSVKVIKATDFSHINDDIVFSLAKAMQADAVIIDEVHVFKYVEDIDDEDVAKMKKNMKYLLDLIKDINPSRIALGLSGTPIVNDIKEAVRLLEMITCVDRADLMEGKLPERVLKLHRALRANGIRQKQFNKFPTKIVRPQVDASQYSEDVASMLKPVAKGGIRSIHQPHAIDKLTFPAKIPAIVDAINGKTIIASKWVDGYVEPLEEAIKQAGYSVCVNHGSRKDNFGNQSAVEAFKQGKFDVLIGSIETICTGIDGFQNHCSNMIIAALPWTAADYNQLIARLARSGQTAKEVTITIPEVYLEVLCPVEERPVVLNFGQCRQELINAKAKVLKAAVEGETLTNEQIDNLTSKAGLMNHIKGYMLRIEGGGAML